MSLFDRFPRRAKKPEPWRQLWERKDIIVGEQSKIFNQEKAIINEDDLAGKIPKSDNPGDKETCLQNLRWVLPHYQTIIACCDDAVARLEALLVETSQEHEVLPQERTAFNFIIDDWRGKKRVYEIGRDAQLELIKKVESVFFDKIVPTARYARGRPAF